MLTYPVHFPRVRYNGAKPNLRAKAAETNQLIARVEKFVNEEGEIRVAPVHEFTYAEIAEALGLAEEDVATHCMIDGGHHGFKVLRDGLALDQALAEAEAEAEKEAHCSATQSRTS